MKKKKIDRKKALEIVLQSYIFQYGNKTDYEVEKEIKKSNKRSTRQKITVWM